MIVVIDDFKETFLCEGDEGVIVERQVCGNSPRTHVINKRGEISCRARLRRQRKHASLLPDSLIKSALQVVLFILFNCIDKSFKTPSHQALSLNVRFAARVDKFTASYIRRRCSCKRSNNTAPCVDSLHVSHLYYFVITARVVYAGTIEESLGKLASL